MVRQCRGSKLSCFVWLFYHYENHHEIRMKALALPASAW